MLLLCLPLYMGLPLSHLLLLQLLLCIVAGVHRVGICRGCMPLACL